MNSHLIQNDKGQLMHPPITPMRAKAGLGVSSLLRTFLLPKKQPVKAQQTAPEQPKTPAPEPKEDMEAKLTELELTITNKLDDLRKELGEKHKLEIDSLKNKIEEALNEPSETA